MIENKDPSKAPPPLHNPTTQRVLQEQAPTTLWIHAALLHRGPPEQAPPHCGHLLHQTLSLTAEFSPMSQPALMPTCPWWVRSVRVMSEGRRTGPYKTIKGWVPNRTQPPCPRLVPIARGGAPVWSGVNRACSGLAQGLRGWVGYEVREMGLALQDNRTRAGLCLGTG